MVPCNSFLAGSLSGYLLFNANMDATNIFVIVQILAAFRSVATSVLSIFEGKRIVATSRTRAASAVGIREYIYIYIYIYIA